MLTNLVEFCRAIEFSFHNETIIAPNGQFETGRVRLLRVLSFRNSSGYIVALHTGHSGIEFLDPTLSVLSNLSQDPLFLDRFLSLQLF